MRQLVEAIQDDVYRLPKGGDFVNSRDLTMLSASQAQTSGIVCTMISPLTLARMSSLDHPPVISILGDSNEVKFSSPVDH